MYRYICALFLTFLTLPANSAIKERYRLSCWDFAVLVFNTYQVSTDFGGVTSDGAPYEFRRMDGYLRIYELPPWFANPNGKYHQQLAVESNLISDIFPRLQTGSVELQSTGKNGVLRKCQAQN